jgi:peptide/nickel transport system permease protein
VVVRFVVRRLLALIPIVLVVATFVFLLTRVIPGNPAALMLGDQATTSQIAALTKQLGLDAPVGVQYLRWLGQVFLHANLGESLYFQMPVTEVIGQRIEPTALLALGGLLVAVGLGVPFGVIAAARHDRLLDRLLMGVALLGLSVPGFWLGLNLILVFALALHALPSGGFQPLGTAGLAGLRYLILPCCTIGFASSALIARMARASVLDVMSLAYVRTARAKGLAERVVLYRHVLKNAMIPTMTLIGLIVADLFSGAIVTETVFTIAGAGRLMIDSVQRRDYPVIEGAVMAVAAFYVVINFLVDLTYAAIDPRIRYG